MVLVVPHNSLHWPSLAICTSQNHLAFRKPSEGQKILPITRIVRITTLHHGKLCRVTRLPDSTIWFS